MFKRTLTVALIALLVLSPIASMLAVPGPTGSADGLIYSCDMFGLFNTCADDGGDYAPDGEYTDKLEAYNDAKSLETHLKTGLTMAENSVHDAENQAWIEAESAFFEARVGGKNYSAAKQAGLDAIESHYATRQANLVELQNNVMLDLYTIQNESKQFSLPWSSPSHHDALYNSYPAIEIGSDILETQTYEGWDNTAPESIMAEIADTRTPTIELLNGDTKTIYNLELSTKAVGYTGSEWAVSSAEGGDLRTTMHFNFLSAATSSPYMGSEPMRDGPGSHPAGYVRGGSDAVVYGGEAWFEIDKISANHIPDEYPQETIKKSKITDPDRWSQLWTDYQESYQSQTTAFETFANNSWTELEDPNSTFSADDLLGRLTQMNEYTLTLEDPTNATFNDGVVALASSGLSAPGANTSYMNISYERASDGQLATVDGMLMSHEAPPGGWETEVWYNTTDLSGAQIVVEPDGSQHLVDGDLRINAIYNADGVQIEDPDLTAPDRTYKATNLTDLRQEVKNMSDRIATLKNQTTTPTTGGSLDAGLSIPGLPGLPPWIPGSGLMQWLIVAVGVVAGLKFLEG